MLIHGKLLVTDHGLMLDEVKSLLQKALRRKEHDLAFKATKELMSGGKDQPKFPNIFIFMFEDHCLNHVTMFERLYRLYEKKDKRACVELISKCYTSRMSACLQVVAISVKYRNYKTFWCNDFPSDSDLCGLVSSRIRGVNVDLLLQNLVKYWREKNKDALISLFGLLNMSVKVEQTPLTKKGLGVLLDKTIKKPSLYHLVLSVLKKNTDDDYMKRVISVCFRFASIPNVNVGLITITVLSQLLYQDLITSKPIPAVQNSTVDWKKVGILDSMPSWAVDKHTYRGKFGNSSKELFRKKYKEIKMSEEQLEEFHGERPKVDIKHFFDVGTVCKNEILPDNPYWEDTKLQYLKQTKQMQKCAKMTTIYYYDLRDSKSVVFVNSGKSDMEEPSVSKIQKGKRKGDTKPESEQPKKKKVKIEKSEALVKDQSSSTSTSSQCNSQLIPAGPLLQLPTGSGKVYTILEDDTMRVVKGPYKIKERQNLCLFYHKAMRHVFGDSHTMKVKEEGKYLVFPLLKSEGACVTEVFRAFYDCISKRSVSEENGRFVERSSLGLIQLHKLKAETMKILPVSIWAHFVWRYVLNIGDSGLYNAIATEDLKSIFGIDMEERRGSVKGNDVINMMFTKLPRKDLVKEIESAILADIEKFHDIISIDIDYEKLKRLYEHYGLKSEHEMCKERVRTMLSCLDRMCRKECGI